MSDSQYKPGLHYIALLTAATTFPLIFMGGLVTSHGAGMSVPDWPNSYGYNMFAFPPRLWIGGILYEHTHRLMGSIVGVLSIILAVTAWKVESRRWVRWLGAGVLGMVIFQGVLGGLRVVLVKLDLAIVHACVAQAFICLATFAAIVTSRWWIEAPKIEALKSRISNLRALAFLAVACVIAVYLQLVVGATMRHYDAGLAIPDLPLAYGKVLPPTDARQLAEINSQRAFELNLRPVTLNQIWLHFGHRIGAILVTAIILLTAGVVFFKHRRQMGLLIPAMALLVFLTAQITLGVLTVLLRKPADIASAHVAVGALVLMSSFVLAVRVLRLYRPSWQEMPARIRQTGQFDSQNTQLEVVPA